MVKYISQRLKNGSFHTHPRDASLPLHTFHQHFFTLQSVCLYVQQKKLRPHTHHLHSYPQTIRWFPIRHVSPISHDPFHTELTIVPSVVQCPIQAVLVPPSKHKATNTAAPSVTHLDHQSLLPINNQPLQRKFLDFL